MKKIMVNCILVISIGIASSAISAVRTVSNTRISGVVMDASNRTPLHFANVYLSGTTIGAATDEEGKFTIVNIPTGKYELVISMVGYKLYSESVELDSYFEDNKTYWLRPDQIKAPNLQVEAPFPHEWKYHLSIFTRAFLGMSGNARHCKINNPEVLDFKLNQRTNRLKATASAPLVIENRSLGYRIHFILMDFACQIEGGAHFLGKSRFEALEPANKKEAKKWKKNRIKTYQGSLKHFLVSATENRWYKDGFHVIDVESTRITEDQKFQYSLKAEEMIGKGSSDHTRKFAFKKNYLKVTYKKEYEPKEYNENPANRQTSWLQMNQADSVHVHVHGYTQSAYGFTTYGYWAWERLADTLPLDYLPEE